MAIIIIDIKMHKNKHIKRTSCNSSDGKATRIQVLVDVSLNNRQTFIVHSCLQLFQLQLFTRVAWPCTNNVTGFPFQIMFPAHKLKIFNSIISHYCTA